MLFSIWRTKKGLEFMTACLSVMFFAVKSWNFGLIIIGLLFAGRGFDAFYSLRSSDEQGSTLICSSI